jgi:hypothetical protein
MGSQRLFLQLCGSAGSYQFVTIHEVTDVFFGTSCTSENANEFHNFRSHTFDSFRCSCMINLYEIVIGNGDRNTSFVKSSARLEGYIKMELKESVDKICLFLDVYLPKHQNIMKACEVEYCCLPVRLSPSQNRFCITAVLAPLQSIKYIEA